MCACVRERVHVCVRACVCVHACMCVSIIYCILYSDIVIIYLGSQIIKKQIFLVPVEFLYLSSH